MSILIPKVRNGAVGFHGNKVEESTMALGKSYYLGEDINAGDPISNTESLKADVVHMGIWGIAEAPGLHGFLTAHKSLNLHKASILDDCVKGGKLGIYYRFRKHGRGIFISRSLNRNDSRGRLVICLMFRKAVSLPRSEQMVHYRLFWVDG